MKHSLLALLLFSAFNVQAAPSQTDRQQLEQMVETFRLSLINKDKASFMKLLYSETIPWIGVIKDKSMNMIEDRGDKVSKITPGASAVKFIDSIVSDTEAIEEKFDNVRIDSDGDIAQVYFDYNFNRGDYRSNWGAGGVATGAHHARLEDQFRDLVDGIQSATAAEKSTLTTP